MDVLEREGKMGRRGFMQGLVATGLALAATSVIAAELSNFVEAKDGARGCWSRDYSAGHLADHPDQQVTSMRFTMQYDQDFHYFQLDAALRSGRSGRATGTCSNYEGVLFCGVDCDGGGVILSPGGDGKALLDLSTQGYIRMTDSCGEEETEGFSLDAGIDDKEFLLSPLSGKACKPLDWVN
jgi:hypothetical protein